MKAYQPKIEALLIKSRRRKEVFAGLPVGQKQSWVGGVDLTEWLGESGGIRLMKGIRDPAGAFSITLSDRPHKHTLDTLVALIEPMDVIEFRMAHDPSEYAKSNNGKLPIVMRGLVSDVRRSMTMGADGRPSRTVTVTGQDWGKLLQILRIIYLNNVALGDNILTTYKFFEKYSAGQPKQKPVADFIADVLKGFLNPYLADLAGQNSGGNTIGTTVGAMTAEVTAKGLVDAPGVSSWPGGSLHQMLSFFGDVGPFNELYTEDREDDVCLVLRPNPFELPDGTMIQSGVKRRPYSVVAKWQPGDVPDLTISDAEIVAENLGRSDAGVANVFWVTSKAFALNNDGTMRLSAQDGQSENYLLLDYLNSKASVFGIRKMEVESNLGDPRLLGGDGQKEAAVSTDQITYRDWIGERRATLAKQNQDNAVFEQGSFRLRGNERLRAGMYLTITRGDFQPRYYVTRVEHEYSPFRGFFTTAHVERGTGYVLRQQRANISAWALETNQSGIK